MPVVFLVNANNSSISTRLAFDSPEESIKKIVDRFESFGSLLTPGTVSQAEDVAAGIRSVRGAVDATLETGKPTYAICSYPFRPLGHASDGHPGADPFLLYQFDTFRDTLLDQVCNAAEEGQAGAEIADELGRIADAIVESCKFGMTGTSILNREQVKRLSVPGCLDRSEKEVMAEAQAFGLEANYLLGKVGIVEGGASGRGRGRRIVDYNRTYSFPCISPSVVRLRRLVSVSAKIRGVLSPHASSLPFDDTAPFAFAPRIFSENYSASKGVSKNCFTQPRSLFAV